MTVRILVLSAYDATSHRLWRERLQGLFPDYAWTCLSLPPRHFNWRLRGNSLLWGFAEGEILQAEYDLLLATSMVDLSSLRGFIPKLARLPTIVYFHENQFVYPAGRQRSDNVEPLLVPLYAALCADRIVFNSAFNRATFLDGAEKLLQRLPDTLPTEVRQRLRASSVIPVPLPALARSSRRETSADRLEVVWNHRWEYDKGTDLLLALVQEIHSRSLPIRLHVVGEQFREQPVAFTTIDTLLNELATTTGLPRGHFAHIEAAEQYYDLLRTCDVVLSTARHDFQGLAIQEAVLSGCAPLAPDALVYPEYLAPAHRYPVTGNLKVDATTIADRLTEWLDWRRGGRPLPQQALDAFELANVRARYAQLFEDLLRA